MKITRRQLSRLTKEIILKEHYDSRIIINDGLEKMGAAHTSSGGGSRTVRSQEPKRSSGEKGGSTSSESGLSNNFLKEVLWKIIATEGKRKNYTDLFKLDGGTVGIAHFAAGGLGGLYEAMGDSIVKKYFGKYNKSINSVSALKKATKRGRGYCRVSRDGSPNDCWNSMEWWKNGMYDFVNDKSNNEIQISAWMKSHGQPALKLAKQYSSIHPEWSSKRGVAVLCCFVNSGGVGGAKSWTKSGQRSPNESINYYTKFKAKRVRTRFLGINEFYPDPNFKPNFKPSAWKRSYSPGTIASKYRNQHKPKSKGSV